MDLVIKILPKTRIERNFGLWEGLPYLNCIDKDERGDLTKIFGVFPLFTTHNSLKTTVAQKLNNNETYQKQI